MPKLLDAVAEAVLEDRHHAAARMLLDGDYPIGILQGSGEWLLANHVFARRQDLKGLGHVERGGRAQIDDVELGQLAQSRQVGERTSDAVLLRHLARLRCVDVTDGHHLEQLRQALVGVEVLTADPAADEPDSQRVAHSVSSTDVPVARWAKRCRMARPAARPSPEPPVRAGTPKSSAPGTSRSRSGRRYPPEAADHTAGRPRWRRCTGCPSRRRGAGGSPPAGPRRPRTSAAR